MNVLTMPVFKFFLKPMLNIDLFCDVIDNFGDAGVCWRLARLLTKEKGDRVRLFINRPETLQALAPNLNSSNLPQTLGNIAVMHWDECLKCTPGDVVIETFGCRLPDEFEKKIAAKSPQPLWINLEYLSAEDWVEGCHCLPSPHPSLSVQKYFFFPGVTKKTGGIMIENDLLTAQNAFEQHRSEFLQNLGLQQSVFTVFVFCYPEAPLEHFYEALSKDAREVNVLIPKSAAADKWLKLCEDNLSETIHTRVLPMVPQENFDQLLWCADSLIIRGEDSFVRAQLAAKPFIWNIYPQTESTHIKKLKAFASRLTSSYGELQPLWLEMNIAWNERPEEIPRLWPQWRNSTEELSICSQSWRNDLLAIGSLSENLCKFIELKLK
ncbi:elongation factor P maturation arginine rhamnosyltransferase EarP [uncultured Parasutterella sp.]|uniref:elongation factor P maturation arginine rhamnosyltransferase EarP n=1 Tax=uncultured Parasutterella sp. TaxID=1263098 RepID=UPI00272A8606|nr:elongation factor P maturation arginine rhamnosyltransferase EarP [uncultured Parasutterella sp.]